MNENTSVDSIFFCFRPLCLIVFLFCLHFCILSYVEIIRCIVKSMIATSTYFLLKYNWKKRKFEKCFWAPEFGRPNQHTGLLSGLNMSLLDNTFPSLPFSWKTLALILKSKIVSPELLEITCCSQLQIVVKGKVCFFYNNNNFVAWLVKLDFTNVTSDAPLTSVCRDIKLNKLLNFETYLYCCYK